MPVPPTPEDGGTPKPRVAEPAKKSKKKTAGVVIIKRMKPKNSVVDHALKRHLCGNNDSPTIHLLLPASPILTKGKSSIC